MTLFTTETTLTTEWLPRLQSKYGCESFTLKTILHKATRKADGHFDLTCCSKTHVYTIYACTLTSTMYAKGTGTVAPGWVWPRKTMQLATGANKYRHNLLLHTALDKTSKPVCTSSVQP